MGPAATTLIAIVASVVQQLKRLPAIVSLQEKFPAYQVASLALGVAGAYLMALPNPIVAGILIGLSASGAYDIVADTKAAAIDTRTIADKK